MRAYGGRHSAWVPPLAAITRADRDEAIYNAFRGDSHAEIAALFRLDRSTIRRVLARHAARLNRRRGLAGNGKDPHGDLR